MADKNKITIRLHLYDTDMAVKVDRNEEAMYRDVATLISQVVGNYTQFYQGFKTEKEILYMALVDIAMRYEKEAERNDTTPYSDMMKKLTEEINAAMSDKNTP